MGKNKELSSFFLTITILGIALVESAAIYGLIAGLFSVPRLIFNNILNGIATFNAFIQYVAARRHKKEVAWDKTEHLEGVGVIPSDTTAYATITEKPSKTLKSNYNLSEAIKNNDRSNIIDIIESIPKDDPKTDLERTIASLYQLAESDDYLIRAPVSKVVGYLNWSALQPIAINLLYDKEWVVRANAAKSLLRFPNLENTINRISKKEDKYAWEVFTKSLEQDSKAYNQVMELMHADSLEPSSKKMLESTVLFA